MMHRFYVHLDTEEQWYKVIREANQWFGHKGWNGQGNVRRKLVRPKLKPLEVWFEVPDLQFVTWLGVKYSLTTEIKPGK